MYTGQFETLGYFTLLLLSQRGIETDFIYFMCLFELPGGWKPLNNNWYSGLQAKFLLRKWFFLQDLSSVLRIYYILIKTHIHHFLHLFLPSNTAHVPSPLFLLKLMSSSSPLPPSYPLSIVTYVCINIETQPCESI